MPDTVIKSLDGGEFCAYSAYCDGGNGPGVIVIHELFGINAAIKSVCDNLASKGFLAICPYLFWRQKPANSLTELPVIEWDEASSLYKNFDTEAGVRDLLATLAHFRKTAGCNGRVGSIGYGLGGKLAWLMATRSDVDCSVSYYGLGIESLLDEVYDIRMPFLLHMAGQDKLVPQYAQQKITAAIGKNACITGYVYDGAEHGFARPQGQSFNKEAAETADKRTQEFLAKNLFG